MTKQYQHYSTSLKIYYSLGLQEQFVSMGIRSAIPPSTASSWKHQRFQDIVGVDLEKNIQQNLNEIQLLYHTKGTIPRKIATAQIRFIVLLTSFFEKAVFRKAVRTHKTELINFLDRFADQLSYKRLAELLGMSPKTLYNWRTEVKFKCDHSALLLCLKRHPNQATISEVNTIKKWLSIPEYQHWSIRSIWAKAFKQGETALSEPAWYHYNRLLAIRASILKGKKKKHQPLVAEKVNQIWHADITVFKTLNGVKHYIYTVMDNYSRYIHAWHIDTIVSAEIRIRTIRDAIQSAFGSSSFSEVQLVTDGGPENDNINLRDFVQGNNINHTIALKDIVQSNSMMEAFYHTAKYRYLYLKILHNTQELLTACSEMIKEYHFEKPHYALGIYTPSEVLNGADIAVSHRNTYLEAAKTRREVNRNANCQQKCR